MSYKIIYHGSDRIIEKPLFNYPEANINNDYGKGFYCTQNLDMAKEWANRKTQRGFANKYSFDERGLKILDLTDKDNYSVLNWIAILVHHRQIDDDLKIEYKESFDFLERYYIDVTKYDVIIGYRADDAYFRFPKMFISNVLTYEKMQEIYKLGNLGKQYVLISEKAFGRIKFVKAIESEPIFHERYLRRKDSVDSSYRELERQELKSKGKRIFDLIKETL